MVKHANCHFLGKLFHGRPSLGSQVLKNLRRNQSKRILSQDKIFYSRIHFLSIQLKSKVLGQSGVHNKSKTPRSRVTK